MKKLMMIMMALLIGLSVYSQSEEDKGQKLPSIDLRTAEGEPFNNHVPHHHNAHQQ